MLVRFELRHSNNDYTITASSNEGAIGSLFDASTETFWETGQNDMRANLELCIGAHPVLPGGLSACEFELHVHMDNARDVEHRVTAVEVLDTVRSAAYMRYRTHTTNRKP